MFNLKRINTPTEINKTAYMLKVKLVLKYFGGLWQKPRTLDFFFALKYLVIKMQVTSW